MPLLDYSTKIPYERTMSQVEAILMVHGAKDIYKKIDNQGHVYALIFTLPSPDGNLPIRLPIDANATFEVLKKQCQNRQVAKRFATEDHARRVAWRIIKDWLEAQVWLVETQMAKMEEILLPYMMVTKDKTLYETMIDRHFLLDEGKEE